MDLGLTKSSPTFYAKIPVGFFFPTEELKIDGISHEHKKAESHIKDSERQIKTFVLS